MSHPFVNRPINTEGPALGAFAITPADGSDMAHYIRQVTIGTEGIIVYHDWDGVVWTTGSLPEGSYPMCARRILSTGTTATGLTGWI